MIILPKQLHTSAFVADMKELGLDSEEFSRVCEKSLTWRGKDSQSRTWLQRWKRVNWMRLLCSRTLRPSHIESFTDAWTSSVAASRANPSVLLDSVKELKIQDTCSHTLQTELQNADQTLFSSKTWKELSQQKHQKERVFSNMSSERWKIWITQQRQEYSQRVKSAHHIKEKECSSWATPTCHIAKEGAFPAEYTRNTLTLTAQAVGIQNLTNWATPDCSDRRGQNSKQQGLSNQVKKLTSSINGPQDQLKSNTTGKNHGQRLNPNWVEQLMGIPVRWTDLGSWATE